MRDRDSVLLTYLLNKTKIKNNLIQYVKTKERKNIKKQTHMASENPPSTYK